MSSALFDLKIRAIEAHRSQQDAREFVEMLRQSKELDSSASEYFYRAEPRDSKPGKEWELFYKLA